MDTNKLLALQVQQLDKERRDLQQRVKLLVKKADHIERAYRKEEIKLLDKDYEDQQKIDQAYHAAIEKAQMEAAKNQYDKDMLVKARLKDMLGDYKAFKSTLMKKREEEFKAKRLEAERRLKEAKEARLKEFKAAKEAELARALKAEEERAQQEEEKRLAAERMILMLNCHLLMKL